MPLLAGFDILARPSVAEAPTYGGGNGRLPRSRKRSRLPGASLTAPPPRLLSRRALVVVPLAQRPEVARVEAALRRIRDGDNVVDHRGRREPAFLLAHDAQRIRREIRSSSSTPSGVIAAAGG